MAADLLKLFGEKRLSPSEPHHLEYIKGRLAALKIEDAAAYENYSTFYGVGVDVKVTSQPEEKEEEKPVTKNVVLPIKKVVRKKA